MRVFCGSIGLLLAILIRMDFNGSHNRSTLSVTTYIFGLPLLLAIHYSFLVCALSHILGWHYILVHCTLLI